ncbi:hypothetical protein ACDW82_12680 [Alcaligenes faecalis]|uniref:hypothetical protein n=1 Tax=Alcaligenes faecalis TaxID=511 RepID=UPI003555C2DA
MMQAVSHLMPGVQDPIQFNCLSIKYMTENAAPCKENTPVSAQSEGKVLPESGDTHDRLLIKKQRFKPEA